MARLAEIETGMNKIGKGIEKNAVEWQAIEQSIALLKYTLEHLIASAKVKQGSFWNKDLVMKLDEACIEAITWIEEDWDRNRYPDDPNKNGVYLKNQHLLFRFKQMHDYHIQILEE